MADVAADPKNLSLAQRDDPVLTQRDSGIAPYSLAKLIRVFDETPNLERVSLFGNSAELSVR